MEKERVESHPSKRQRLENSSEENQIESLNASHENPLTQCYKKTQSKEFYTDQKSSVILDDGSNMTNVMFDGENGLLGGINITLNKAHTKFACVGMNPHRNFLPECRIWCPKDDHYMSVTIEELENLVEIRAKNIGWFTVSSRLQLNKIGHDILILEKKLSSKSDQIQKMFLSRISIENLKLLLPIIETAFNRLNPELASIFMDSEVVEYSEKLTKYTTIEDFLKLCLNNDSLYDNVQSRFRLELLGSFPNFYFNELIKRVQINVCETIFTMKMKMKMLP